VCEKRVHLLFTRLQLAEPIKQAKSGRSSPGVATHPGLHVVGAPVAVLFHDGRLLRNSTRGLLALYYSIHSMGQLRTRPGPQSAGSFACLPSVIPMHYMQVQMYVARQKARINDVGWQLMSCCPSMRRSKPISMLIRYQWPCHIMLAHARCTRTLQVCVSFIAL